MTRARLTLGLMGLDELNLRVLSSASDDETEKKNANKVCERLIVAPVYLYVNIGLAAASWSPSLVTGREFIAARRMTLR